MTIVEGRPPHRVRVVQAKVAASAYLEIDGHALHPSAVTVQFKVGHMPLVHISLPAIVENLEALALLDVTVDDADRDPLEEC